MEPFLTPEKKEVILSEIIEKIKAYYIFPKITKKIINYLDFCIKEGRYTEISDFPTFCYVLTEDLQNVSKDLHFYVEYNPKNVQNIVLSKNDESGDKNTIEKKEREKLERYNNFYLQKIERLPGNIGYIRIDDFSSPEFGGDAISGAMQFLSNTYALIFDVRNNGGGEPSMVQLIISYLVDAEPKHLISFYDPIKKKEEQTWTLPYVPGNRYLNKPVYVLISGRSASAAEEFAYDLKYLKRATLIGEKTRGAANAIEIFVIGEEIIFDCPIYKPTNAISKTNWEGVGVEPHHEILQQESLNFAHLSALKTVINSEKDSSIKKMLEFELGFVETKYNAVDIDLSFIKEFEGKYGRYKLILKDDQALMEIKNIKFPLISRDNRIFHLNERLRIELINEGNEKYLLFYMRDQFKHLKIPKE